MKSSLPLEFLVACTPDQRAEADSWWADQQFRSKATRRYMLALLPFVSIAIMSFFAGNDINGVMGWK